MSRVGRRWAATWAAAALAVVGIAVSVATGQYTESVEHRSAQVVLDHRAAVAGWALSVEIERYEDAVTDLAAGLSAQEDMNAADFTTITRPLADAPLPGISGASFLVPADGADVEAVSAFWQARGAAAMAANPSTDEHRFAVFVTAFNGEGTTHVVAGQDLSGLPQLAAALDDARSTGRTAVSDSFVLLKDRGLPRSEQQQAIVLAAPVRSPDDPDGLRGWLLVTARIGDLATATLTDASQGLINASLTVPTTDGGRVVAASVHTDADASTTTARWVPVMVGGHWWTLRVASTPKAEHLRGGYVHLGRALEVGGSAISVLLAVLAWLLLSDRHRARVRVEAATAELRDAETAARGQAQLLEAVVSSIGDGVVVVDGAGEYLLHNGVAEQLLGTGFGRNGPAGWVESDGLFLPDGVTRFPPEQIPLVRALSGETSDDVDMVVHPPDGREAITLTVSARPLGASAGVPGGGAVAVFHDVSTARRLQDQVAEQHEVQERLLGALSDLGEGVVVTEGDCVVYANDAYLQLTGYSLAELHHLPRSALAPDEDTRATFAWYAAQLAEGGRTSRALTTRLRRRDGQVVPVEVNGISIDRSGTVQRVGLVRDLSAKMRAAEQLAEHAQRLETANAELATARDAATAASQAKSTFVARMSHEIRTPLNGVIGLTSLLCASDLTGAQRVMAETAARSGQALLEIVDDILDFAKIEAGKLTVEALPVDLAELLDDVAATFATQASDKDLDLLVDCPPLAVVTDPARVRQVLANLVGNAAKFTDTGSITLRARPTAGGVRIDVLDTGRGIPAQVLPRLFTAFEQADASTTRQFGGTGLGLTISRSLAELLGGSLSVDSEAGRGTTFTLTLPCAAADAPQGPPAVPPGHRVLLLAATTPLRGHLQTLVESWGASVLHHSERVLVPHPRLVVTGPVVTGLVDTAIIDSRHPAAAAVLAGLPVGLPTVVLHHLGSPPVPLPDSCTAVTTLTLPLRASALLPALQAPEPHAATAVPSPPTSATDVPARRLRVLVADDNETNQLVVSLMLTRLGHDSDLVADGQEAVDAAQRTTYDVVLMDCQMPVLDGLDATRALRALDATRNLPIIALTAGATVDEGDACRDAGMDDWLTKPLREHDLRRALERLPSRAAPGRR